jgi:hypothetical protein
MTPQAYQRAFVEALRAPDPCGPLAALTGQAGFAVYRNTVRKAALDALEANFPAVTRLVGKEWLRAAAAEFARVAPPRDATLLRYGAAFPGFLVSFPPAAELPYLPSVARLDWYWNEAHVAADAAPADPAALSGLAPDELLALRLAPHPAARWAWFPDLPARSIWQANRATDADPAAQLASLVWRGEGALITRPASTVQAMPLTLAACSMLDACARGADYVTAASAALAADHATDLTALVTALLRAGAFTRRTFSPLELETPA